MKEMLIHLMQTEEIDCGVSCVHMIFRYYGYLFDYNWLKRKVINSRDGTSLSQMLDLFQQLNVKVNIYTSDYKNYSNQNLSISSNEFPAIALLKNDHTNTFHYIVIYKIKKGCIKYSDPKEIGVKRTQNCDFMNKIKYYIKLDLSSFQYKETDYLIKEKENFVLKSIIEEKSKLIYISILSLSISLIGVFLASKLGLFINIINSNKLFLSNILLFLTLFLSFLIVLKNFISYIKNIISINLIKNIEYKINKNIINILINTEYLDMSKYKSGEIMSRINDCISLSSAISVFIIDLLPNIIISIIGLICLFYLNCKLTIILILACLISLIINVKTFSKIHDKNFSSIYDYSSYYGVLLEMIDGLSEIKTISGGSFYNKMVLKSLVNYKKSSLSKEKYSNNITINQNMISMIMGLILLVFGIIEVVYYNMPLGNLTIFITLSEILQSVFLNLAVFQFNFENFLIGYNRILQVFFNTTAKKNILLKGKRNKIESILLKDLNISYYDKIILNNVNIILNGSNILLTGKSGCGKSTLAKCIAGLFYNYSGNVIINNSDIRKTLEQTYSVIYLSNESTLFEGTIRENVCLGKKILDKTLYKICQQFALMDLITTFPEMIDQKIAPNQSNISTGQKQKIALIRCIIAEPDILILDEALSNIDKTSREKIIESLNELNFIKIYISHNDLKIKRCKKYIIEDKNIFYKGETSS